VPPLGRPKRWASLADANHWLPAPELAQLVAHQGGEQLGRDDAPVVQQRALPQPLPDLGPADLGGALRGPRREADAADRLPVVVSDQQGSRRAVDGLEAAALTLEHGGQLADPGGHLLAGFGLGGGHVLEDQGGSVVTASGRERADHGDLRGHAADPPRETTEPGSTPVPG